jgi:VIT1/CCC1 family predicted Fe2+/Mn2+ transporter
MWKKSMNWQRTIAITGFCLAVAARQAAPRGRSRITKESGHFQPIWTTGRPWIRGCFLECTAFANGNGCRESYGHDRPLIGTLEVSAMSAMLESVGVHLPLIAWVFLAYYVAAVSFAAAGAVLALAVTFVIARKRVWKKQCQDYLRNLLVQGNSKPLPVEEVIGEEVK